MQDMTLSKHTMILSARDQIASARGCERKCTDAPVCTCTCLFSAVLRVEREETKWVAGRRLDVTP